MFYNNSSTYWVKTTTALLVSRPKWKILWKPTFLISGTLLIFFNYPFLKCFFGGRQLEVLGNNVLDFVFFVVASEDCEKGVIDLAHRSKENVCLGFICHRTPALGPSTWTRAKDLFSASDKLQRHSNKQSAKATSTTASEFHFHCQHAYQNQP